MKVRDLCLRNVAVCRYDSTLVQAGALMRQHNVGALPVVDQSERVVGVLTDRDIALEVTRRNERPSEILADEVMAERVVTCSSEDDVRRALKLMVKHRVRRLPVTDGDGFLEGILSIDDVLCCVAGGRNGRTISSDQMMKALDEICRPYERTNKRTRPARRRSSLARTR
jgi:CBS domain-containing protein